MTFARLALALGCIIAALQALAMLVCTRAPTGETTIIPLRPSLVRETDALTIADEAPRRSPRFDGGTLAAGIERMNRIPSLALTPVQRQVMVRALQPLAGRDNSDERALAAMATLRTRFMRAALGMLEALHDEQVRFIVEHHEDCYVTFEASYWPELVARLEAPPAPRESPSSRAR